MFIGYALTWKLEAICAAINCIFNEYVLFLLSTVAMLDLSMKYTL